MLLGSFLFRNHLLAMIYHVDCSRAANGDGAASAPWNTLRPANEHYFYAGDHLLFRSSTVCVGQLTPQGSGRAGMPLVLGAYGPGEKPVLDAGGATGPVIHLLDVEYWNVSGLHLRNEAAAPATRSGLLVENHSGKVLHNIWVSNMTITNIRGWPGGWYSTNAGIGIQTDHTETVSTWDDVRIVDNEFRHVDRIAIAVTPDHDGIGTGMTTRLSIRDNHITDSGGDDILVVKGQGAKITDNSTFLSGSRSVTGCPPKGQYCNKASASIWIAGSEHTLIAGNDVRCYLNEADGQAFDVDWGNRDTTIEHNVSRQNRGGFLLLMPAFNLRSEPTSNEPSSGTVVRYNISESDTVTTGCLRQPAHAGPAALIHFVGDVPNAAATGSRPLIYNNTFVLTAGTIAPLLGSRAGSKIRGSLILQNNIVVDRGTGTSVETDDSNYENNLFYGRPETDMLQGTHSLRADPKFVGPFDAATGLATSMQAYRLKPDSPGWRAGVAVKRGDNAAASSALPPNLGAYPR